MEMQARTEHGARSTMSCRAVTTANRCKPPAPAPSPGRMRYMSLDAYVNGKALKKAEKESPCCTRAWNGCGVTPEVIQSCGKARRRSQVPLIPQHVRPQTTLPRMNPRKHRRVTPYTRNSLNSVRQSRTQMSALLATTCRRMRAWDMPPHKQRSCQEAVLQILNGQGTRCTRNRRTEGRIEADNKTQTKKRESSSTGKAARATSSSKLCPEPARASGSEGAVVAEQSAATGSGKSSKSSEADQGYSCAGNGHSWKKRPNMPSSMSWCRRAKATTKRQCSQANPRAGFSQERPIKTSAAILHEHGEKFQHSPEGVKRHHRKHTLRLV